MTQHNLAVGPGQLERTGNPMKIMEVIGERHRFLASLGHGRREGHAYRGARREPSPATKAEDRIEHRAGGACQACPTIQCLWIRGCPPTSEEVAAIGFILEPTDGAPLD